MTGALTVGSLGERAIIARIRARVPPSPSWVHAGIGDDAALVEPVPRTLDVVTTDALVEGVHFEWRLTTPGDLGAKALAVNLSDLAAMGASPRLAVLSLVLPAPLLVETLDGFIEGFVGEATRTGTALVGGNISRSPGPFVVDVTAIGSVHPRRTLTRGGARPGHELWVSGSVGGASSGLRWLQANSYQSLTDESTDESTRDAVRRYRRPEARTRMGSIVGRTRAASAALDLSDGLADAVRQIADSSGTGAVVCGDAVPLHPAAQALGTQGLDLGLSGGEDYELLFAVPARSRRAFAAAIARAGSVPITRIGVLTREPGVWLERDGRREPLPTGFVHFADGDGRRES